MRVLGLDISSRAVACVEMDMAFGRFEIRDTHELAVRPEIMNATATAQHLLQSLSRQPEKTVVSVPVEISTFRNLQMATKDKKAIRSALEFELEDDLPFEKENLHYDSTIVNTGANGTLVHIGAVKKESFKIFLDDLIALQIDPDLITTDAWAYRCLFSRLNPAPDAPPVLLIGFDHEKTFFYVHDKNRPILYREIPFGVKSIELALAEKLGANPAQIKTWIQDIGVSGIDERVSNAIADVLELFVPELKQTELAARGSLKTSIDQIYITGEGALLPGLFEWLEQASGKPAALFRPLSQLSPAHVTYSEMTEIRYAKALALAMTTVPLDKLPAINLRRGAFAKISASSASALDLIKKPLPYALITLAVFFATKTIEYNYYKNKLSDTDDTLKRAVKTYFGNISDGAARTYLAETEKLKKNIQNDLAKERELSKLLTPNANSPLDFLKNLSQKIGRDVVVDMVHFDAGADNTEPYKENKVFKTSITFLVNNAQMLAKLSEIVEKSFGLKHGPSEEVTQDGRKVLKVQFTGTIGGPRS